MDGIIYIATNKINGKKYVGQTIESLKKRKDRHFRNDNLYFHRALKKYGIDNFNWEEKIYPIDRLNEMEIYWIKELNTKNPNGYNLTNGGEGTRGFYLSEESKNKMRQKLIGLKQSEETKIKRCIALLGNKNGCKGRSLETRKNMAIAHIGKIPWNKGKEWTCQKLSDSLKGNKNAVGSKGPCKKYLLINKEGKELEIENLLNFCRENRLNIRNLYRTLDIDSRVKYDKGWKIKFIL